MKTLSLEVLDGNLQSCIKTFKGSFLCGFIKFLQATMKRKSLENVHKIQATMLKSFFDPMDKQLKRAHTPGTSASPRTSGEDALHVDPAARLSTRQTAVQHVLPR